MRAACSVHVTSQSPYTRKRGDGEYAAHMHQEKAGRLSQRARHSSRLIPNPALTLSYLYLADEKRKCKVTSGDVIDAQGTN